MGYNRGRCRVKRARREPEIEVRHKIGGSEGVVKRLA